MPSLTPLTLPDSETVATEVSEEDQETFLFVASMELMVALRVILLPSDRPGDIHPEYPAQDRPAAAVRSPRG